MSWCLITLCCRRCEWFGSPQVAQVLLTLPYSFSQLGMLSGILFQLFYGLMGSWTAYLISILYVEYRTRKEREKADFRNHVIQVSEGEGRPPHSSQFLLLRRPCSISMIHVVDLKFSTEIAADAQWFEVLDGLLGRHWRNVGLAFNCTFLLFGSVIQLIACARYVRAHGRSS